MMNNLFHSPASSRARFLRSILFIGMFFMGTSCTPKHKVVEETYPNGNPKRECIYRGKGDKQLLLKETFYYSNGKTELTGEYKNGQRHGYWIYYYENGNIWSEGFYNEGKNDGKRLTYFENGRLRYEAWYKNDKRTCIWKFYDEAGNLIREINYSDAAGQSRQ